MKSMRSILVPSSHSIAVREYSAGDGARSERTVRLIAPRTRASFYGALCAERCASGIASLRKKTGLVMATQSGLEEDTAPSTSLRAGQHASLPPVAALLNISSDNVFANTLLFNDDGEYAGFDATEPTSKSGGKAQVTEQIKKKHGYQTLVMIRDGATDLEARRPGGADMFICYGGSVARPGVVAGADWFVTSFADLIQSLD